MEKSTNKSWEKYNIPPIPILAESLAKYETETKAHAGRTANFGCLFFVVLFGTPFVVIRGGFFGFFAPVAPPVVFVVFVVFVVVFGFFFTPFVEGVFGFIDSFFSIFFEVKDRDYHNMYLCTSATSNHTEAHIPELLKVGNIPVALMVLKKINKTDFLQKIMAEKDYKSMAYLLAKDNTIYDSLLPEYAKNGDKIALEILSDLGVREEKILNTELLKTASGEVKARLSKSLMSKFIGKKDFKWIKNNMADDYSLTSQERDTILQLAIQDKAWEWIAKHTNQLEIFQSKIIDPLIIGIYAGDENIIKKAIDQGADIYQKSSYREWNNSNAFEGAFISGNRKIIELFIEMHKDINKTLPNGDSVLHLATKYNFDWLLKIHLQNGYDPNTLDKNGDTLLMTACDNACVEAGLLIIDNGGHVIPS